MADLDHAVTYVAQSKPMSCWAASAAMMMGTTEAEILEQFADFGDDGASEPECQALAARLSMNILPEACRDADGWWPFIQYQLICCKILSPQIFISKIAKTRRVSFEQS